jgi:hypothetical protein
MNNSHFENELQKLVEELSQAERTCDVDRLNQLIADDYIGIGDDGGCFDKATLLQRFRDPQLCFDTHELGELQCRVYNDVGVIIGTVKLKGEYASTEFAGKFAFTDIWARREGNWQVVSSQMTAIQNRL